MNIAVRIKATKAVSSEGGMPVLGGLVPIGHAVKLPRSSQPECPIAVQGSIVEHQHGIPTLWAEAGRLANCSRTGPLCLH